MILTGKKLLKWQDSSRVFLTGTQRRLILTRFGSEPDDGHSWTLQDIYTQIRNFVAHGRWVKVTADFTPSTHIPCDDEDDDFFVD